MTIAPPKRLYTYDELVAEIPATNQPHELWDGELVTMPSPSIIHQKVAFAFHRAIDDWVTARQLGQVIGAPIDMVLSPHRAAQPDVLFVAQDRLSILEDVVRGPADLVAEVVSLGGRHRDRIEKRDLYEQYGIKEYWIIDPESQTIDVLTLVQGRYEVGSHATLGQTAGSRLLPGFQIAAQFLFQATSA